MGKVTKLHGLSLWAFEECMKIEKATGADVFFRYSPHVLAADIDIHVNGWESGKSSDINLVLRFEESYDEEGDCDIDCDDCLKGMCWFDNAIYEVERVRFELECEKRRQTKQDKLDQIAKLQKELEDMDND